MTTTVGRLCQGCGTFTKGIPDWCARGCRARFDRAPFAELHLVAHASRGVSIETAWTLHGEWPRHLREALGVEDAGAAGNGRQP